MPQLGSVPAAYAAVAGGCDWTLPTAAGLSNNDVIALRALRQFRQFRYVSYVACVHYVSSVTSLTCQLRCVRCMHRIGRKPRLNHACVLCAIAKKNCPKLSKTGQAVLGSFGQLCACFVVHVAAS